MTTYRLMRGDGSIVESRSPGRFAGNTSHRIFGRLDCASGKRMMLKKNRVFFRTWGDAIAAGYRPCKNCRPEPNDRYVRRHGHWHPHV
jgi:methylphosphotriester-DNA--protein-cysteine methyltransferase